ncbi:MAG: NAD(P)-dependent oxidoreductase [Ilumatobacteraceae bacterium]
MGREVARRLRFDIRVLADAGDRLARRRRSRCRRALPRPAIWRPWLGDDAVTACLPTTEATIDLFDASVFAGDARRIDLLQRRPGNPSGGGGPDRLLNSGHLRAAILDVTRTEPLPPGDPLWSAPNLYLSPHASASLDRYAERLEELILRNLRHYLDGEPLENEVVTTP